MGGSIAKAVMRGGLADAVRVWGRRSSGVDEVLAGDWGGEVELMATTDLGEVLSGADLIVLATPVGVMRELGERVVDFLEEADAIPGRVVIDIASVKARVMVDVAPVFEEAGISFVPCHPMAGSEKTGWAHSRADLFHGAVCIVTPRVGGDEETVGRVTAFWEALGSRVVKMGALEHDRAVARVSHLPHAVASVLVRVALCGGAGELAGNGLRDSTRVAAGPAEMWSEILLENREAVMESMVDFQDELSEMLAILERKDEEGLRWFLSHAKEMRDGLEGIKE